MSDQNEFVGECDRNRRAINLEGRRSGEKYCHEAQIAEVMNGFVVKVGCKLFVGEKDDLSMLVGYFTKKDVPAKLKKLVKEREAFRTDEAQEAGCDADYVDGPGLPSFLPSTDIGIIKATNGWVVIKHRQAYVVMTKQELVKMID